MKFVNNAGSLANILTTVDLFNSIDSPTFTKSQCEQALFYWFVNVRESYSQKLIENLTKDHNRNWGHIIVNILSVTEWKIEWVRVLIQNRYILYLLRIAVASWFFIVLIKTTIWSDNYSSINLYLKSIWNKYNYGSKGYWDGTKQQFEHNYLNYDFVLKKVKRLKILPFFM